MKKLMFIALLLFITAPVWAQEPSVKISATTYSLKSPHGTCTYDVSCPRFSGLADKAVEKKINSFLAQEFKPQNMKDDEDLAQESRTTFYCKTSYKTTLLKDSVASIRMEAWSHLKGGAYPNSIQKAWTINLKTGDVYDYKSLFLQSARYKERIKSLVENAAVNELHIGRPVIIDRDYENLPFCLTPKSLVLFNLFDTHAVSAFEVSIPYQDIADLIDPKGPLGTYAKQQ